MGQSVKELEEQQTGVCAIFVSGMRHLERAFGAVKLGVYIVHTSGAGLVHTGVGSGRNPHVSAGSLCLRRRECSSSPTSGTVFPQAEAFCLSTVDKA
jgi:hypothetical protein